MDKHTFKHDLCGLPRSGLDKVAARGAIGERRGYLCRRGARGAGAAVRDDCRFCGVKGEELGDGWVELHVCECGKMSCSGGD